MKDGVRIINLARADLVNATDIKAAIADGKVGSYVTDFPTEEVVGVPGIVAIPHLGASTPESEDNCAVMAANELVDYLECGNIKNSVNFPAAFLPCGGGIRVCVLHKNVPAIIAQISTVLSDEKINIENMVNASKKDNAYTLLEVSGDVTEAVVEKLSAIENVIRVRVIK
jgi:D-3-phosphoglycerate dehydrogenase